MNLLDKYQTIELTREWKNGDAKRFNFPYLQPYLIDWEHWEEKVDKFEMVTIANKREPSYKPTLVILTVFHKFISAN